MGKKLKLSKLYNVAEPLDLFTLLPQEMEIAYIRGLADKLTDIEIKQIVMDKINDIILDSNVAVDMKWISTFYDVINDASKGKYAINR